MESTLEEVVANNEPNYEEPFYTFYTNNSIQKPIVLSEETLNILEAIANGTGTENLSEEKMIKTE